MTLQPGRSASFSKTVSEWDIYAIAGATGDMNPLHVNAEEAARSPFGERIAHSILPAGLISTVLGMYLPGPGTVYLHQWLDFTAPVKIGDTVTATVTVLDVIDPAKGIYRLETVCVNQRGQTVADGEAVVKYLPPERPCAQKAADDEA